jgi:di/tricarboxylate transporter
MPIAVISICAVNFLSSFTSNLVLVSICITAFYPVMISMGLSSAFVLTYPIVCQMAANSAFMTPSGTFAAAVVMHPDNEVGVKDLLPLTFGMVVICSIIASAIMIPLGIATL